MKSVKVGRSLLELETAPLPLPTRSCEPFGLLYHPVEKCLWMLDFTSGQLWRYAHERWSLISNAVDLMPTGYSRTYSWSFHFYWDGERKAPVCFATGYGGSGLPIMGVWDGKRFAESTPKGALKSSNGDAFAWDAGRNVLVHFVGSTKLRARELDATGVWRDVGPAQELVTDPVDLMAGYDGDLGATVCISAAGIAIAWDGVRWKSVPVETTYPWFPYATAPAPRTRAMVFAYAPRETGEWPAHVLEQSKGKLRPRPVTTMRLSGGMAHDPDRDVTYVFGPWFGSGTLQRTLGTYDGGSFQPAGRACAAQVPLAGPGHFFWDGVGSTYYELYVAPGTTTPLASMLPTLPPSIGVAMTHHGIYSVASTGEVASCAFEGKAFAKSTAAPRGFTPRTAPSLGADYDGDRVLLVSGTPTTDGPFAKDAWLLQAGKWKKLAITGPAPALGNAKLTYDAARARWIVAGGRDRSFKEGQKTFETDEAKWKSFVTRFVNAKGKATGAAAVALMAYDAPSRQTFCLAGRYGFDQVYVYEGEGVWRLVDETYTRGAYDVTTRRLAWRELPGDGLVRYLDLGALLSSYAAAHIDAPEGKTKAEAARAAPRAIAGEVWLRYEDEGSDKVWFARLDGASFTVRSGKRGGALQAKTTSCKTAALARAKYTRAVEAKLARGYEHAPEREAIARLPGLKAWHIVRSKGKGDGWGGVPRGVGVREWPACAECKAPLIHVATIHAHPERLPLKKHAALMAFICGGELCEFWDPEMGANKVLLRTAADLAKPTLEAPPKGVETARPWAFGYKEVFEIDEAREPNAPMLETCDKVGGYPAWIQRDDRPRCSQCKKPMRFVAQLNEHDLNFAGGGISYLFVCEAEHKAVLLMQR